MANRNLLVSNEWMGFDGGGFRCRSDLFGDRRVWLFVRLNSEEKFGVQWNVRCGRGVKRDGDGVFMGEGSGVGVDFGAERLMKYFSRIEKPIICKIPPVEG